MRPATIHSAQPRGFTLVELTAVIVLLSFLALMGVPTLVRAKQKTRRASCELNLRETGIAIRSYAEANGDRLPGPVCLLASSSYEARSTNELAWYVGNRLGCPPPQSYRHVVPQLQCPEREEQRRTEGKKQTAADYVLADGRSLGSPPFGQTGAPAVSPLRLDALKALANPANTLAMADADKANVNPTLPNWKGLPYTPVHGKLRNQLFFDWHVESRSW